MKTDLQIQNDVMDELKWEPYVNSSEIGVAVKNGVVTLSGMVDSFSKKIASPPSPTYNPLPVWAAMPTPPNLVLSPLQRYITL